MNTYRLEIRTNLLFTVEAANEESAKKKGAKLLRAGLDDDAGWNVPGVGPAADARLYVASRHPHTDESDVAPEMLTVEDSAPATA